MTDYCTSWPDGWPTWAGGTGDEWAHCCKAHDAFYEQQAALDLFAYLGAHWDLAACVSSVSFAMAAAMFLGLCVAGLPYLFSRHNRHKPGSTDRDR